MSQILVHDSQSTVVPSRAVIYRTRGRGHGDVFRLMSPSDLGEQLKPFVFLDSFAGVMSEFASAGGMHPHSGIGTVTVFTRGDVHFDDPDSGSGYIGYGGVEWMRAGGGVWHGKELSSGKSEHIHGFQLWLALPAELELSEVQSQYVESRDMPQVGPAYVIVGSYQDASSPVKAPAGVNYLLVTLAPGERWTYATPTGHAVGWIALSKGSLKGDSPAASGELIVFSEDDNDIVLEAGQGGATFVLGSAIPHPHELHLGYYSVHTSAEALNAGERNIERLRQKLFELGNRQRASGATPIYRG
ncbi:pirin family protein [uncultured Stenotrophomonas sp.]|uniref:pirin family protein n=1 Tax=uncultured Stenotrophomonas sp. TaxID=165438 RepID=UPI0025E29D7F|nr:pirin family protein [uncultured Stenotrophomonas sp.]